MNLGRVFLLTLTGMLSPMGVALAHEQSLSSLLSLQPGPGTRRHTHLPCCTWTLWKQGLAVSQTVQRGDLISA